MTITAETLIRASEEASTLFPENDLPDLHLLVRVIAVGSGECLAEEDQTRIADHAMKLLRERKLQGQAHQSTRHSREVD